MVRRLVLAMLVIGALALLTISFRSPTAGALHDVQGAGATALRPFQIAAQRVARPFRDAYGYFSGLAGAKAENERLRRELSKANALATANLANAQLAQELQKLMQFEEGTRYPKDYRSVNTTVISYPTSAFAQQVTIAAGSTSGIRVNTPVVTGDGLIGRAVNVSAHTALVTLLTDPDSNVPARDVTNGVNGLIRHGQGNTLFFDLVSKEKKINKGDIIVTRGTVDRRYPDIYPFGIAIGRVISVGIRDTASFLTVQVAPLARFDSLDAVAALVSTKHR